jgi:hypothetical protein
MSVDVKERISSQPQVRVQIVPSSKGSLTILGFGVKNYSQLHQWQWVATGTP